MRAYLVLLSFLIVIFMIGRAASVAAVENKPETILIVLTNVAKVPGTDRATGFWAEEFVIPCEIFKKEGFNVVTASVNGGIPPVDPASLDPAMIDRQQAKHMSDYLANNRELMTSIALKDIKNEDYNAVFIVGGHGVMWDLSTSELMHALAVRTLAEGKVLSAVCHGPGAIANARKPDGEFLVKGRKVTGFSNAEEKAGKMDSVVPYSLEDALRKNSGGLYAAGEMWKSHVVVDGNLVTGQNPSSSAETANAVVKAMKSMTEDPSLKQK